MTEVFKNIEEKYIQVNEIKLHTIIIGFGKPLILLHGFPDFWYGWKNTILALKDSFKLIVPDMRGYNLSDKPENVEKYGLNYLVEDIKNLAKKLNLTKFYLAGHDWGGMVAWAIGEKYPELIEKLIVLNAPHPILIKEIMEKNEAQRKASGYISRFLKPGGENFLFENNYQALKLSVFGTARNRNAFTQFDKEKYIEAWSQSGAITAGVNYYRANINFEGWTGIIKIPTLVIFGMKDDYVKPFFLEGLPKYVKDLKIVRSENSSHWIMYDDPILVNSSIKDFLLV
ncbi:MAG: alpha/beta fold hydrolase [Promethearchaeota archaeon]